MSNTQAARFSACDLSDFQPEERSPKMDKGLVRRWCATAPITLAQAQALTLPRIGLSLWSNERCDVWGRSGWERDRRSERDLESELEREGWSDAEVVEGAVFRKQAIVVKAILYFYFFFLFGSPLQTDVWAQLENYVIQTRFMTWTKTHPHYTQRAFQQRSVCVVFKWCRWMRFEYKWRPSVSGRNNINIYIISSSNLAVY